MTKESMPLDGDGLSGMFKLTMCHPVSATDDKNMLDDAKMVNGSPDELASYASRIRGIGTAEEPSFLRRYNATPPTAYEGTLTGTVWHSLFLTPPRLMDGISVEMIFVLFHTTPSKPKSSSAALTSLLVDSELSELLETLELEDDDLEDELELELDELDDELELNDEDETELEDDELDELTELELDELEETLELELELDELEETLELELDELTELDELELELELDELTDELELELEETLELEEDELLETLELELEDGEELDEELLDIELGMACVEELEEEEEGLDEELLDIELGMACVEELLLELLIELAELDDELSPLAYPTSQNCVIVFSIFPCMIWFASHFVVGKLCLPV